MRKSLLVVCMISLFVIPSLALSAGHGPVISIDGDGSTDGMQLDPVYSPGDIFTSDVILTLPDGITLSSFQYSLKYDPTELMPSLTPECDSLTQTLIPGFLPLGDCRHDNSDPSMPLFGGLAQGNLLGQADGPDSWIVASIEWKAIKPMRDGMMDIMPGFFEVGDGAFDGAGIDIKENVTFNGATVVPEPVSTVLFLIGGATLGARRFLKRKI